MSAQSSSSSPSTSFNASFGQHTSFTSADTSVEHTPSQPLDSGTIEQAAASLFPPRPSSSPVGQPRPNTATSTISMQAVAPTNISVDNIVSTSADRSAQQLSPSSVASSSATLSAPPLAQTTSETVQKTRKTPKRHWDMVPMPYDGTNNGPKGSLTTGGCAFCKEAGKRCRMKDGWDEGDPCEWCKAAGVVCSLQSVTSAVGSSSSNASAQPPRNLSVAPPRKRTSSSQMERVQSAPITSSTSHPAPNPKRRRSSDHPPPKENTMARMQFQLGKLTERIAAYEAGTSSSSSDDEEDEDARLDFTLPPYSSSRPTDEMAFDPAVHSSSALLASPNPLIVAQERLLVRLTKTVVEKDAEVKRLQAELEVLKAERSGGQTD